METNNNLQIDLQDILEYLKEQMKYVKEEVDYLGEQIYYVSIPFQTEKELMELYDLENRNELNNFKETSIGREIQELLEENKIQHRYEIINDANEEFAAVIIVTKQ